MSASGSARNDTEMHDHVSEEERPSEEERLRAQVKKLFRHLDGAEQEFQEKEDALKQAIGLLMALARSTVKPDTQALLDQLGREIRQSAQPDVVKTSVDNIKEQITQEVPPSSLAALRESWSTSERKEPQGSREQPGAAEPHSQQAFEKPSGFSRPSLERERQSEARDQTAPRRTQTPPLPLVSPVKRVDTNAQTTSQAPMNRASTSANKEPFSPPVSSVPPRVQAAPTPPRPQAVGAPAKPEPSRPVVSPVSSSKPVSIGLQEGEVEGKIRTVLSALLDQVHLKDQRGLQEKITAIKTTLTEGGLFQRLPQVQKQLTEVLVYYRNLNDTERTRLEDVLKELIAKLAEIEKSVLNGLLENHQETMSDNAKFAERLEGQVASIDEIAHLKDLNAVRTAVSSRTERMRAAIQVKREADAALSAAFTDKVHTLERQLHDANQQLSSMTNRVYQDVLLTGVYNRLAFSEKLGQEIARFERYQHPVSLIIFDMDRFKSINDTYGHQAGDWALQTLAARVKPALRAPDFFARFGGDEFAIVLPDTPLSGAVVVAERLRLLIEGTSFAYETQKLQVSLSVGVAGVHMGDTVETVLERADQALYLAKEQGRNRVCSEDQLPPPSPSKMDKMVGFFSRNLSFRK